MGCAPAAQSTTETAESGSLEERVVSRFEDALLFQRHKATDLCTALENCANKGKLYEASFFGLLREMELCVQGLEQEKSPLRSFYQQFRDGRGFELKRLRLLTALLARGEAKEKAAILFDIAVPGQATIDIQSVTDLVDDLLAISIDLLPTFAVRPDEGGLTQKSCVSLGLTLGKFKETVRDRLVNQVFQRQSSMNKEEFGVRVETDEGLKSMLTSKGLRRLLQAEAENPYNSATGKMEK